jgi:hypothetical protein
MNFILTFFGWLLWNWFEFGEAKDRADDRDVSFNLRAYTRKKWDNWIGTLIVAGFLLLVGHAGLGMELVKSFNEKLGWSDLYYAGSGIAYEALVWLRRKVKNKFLMDKPDVNLPPHPEDTPKQ